MVYKIPLWIQVSILFLVLVLLRVAQIDREPHFDELYHLLAARSWAAEGTLRIAEGIYDRTPLYTIMLGWLFRLFGDGLVVARLPSVLFGSLWVVAVFLWTRRIASPHAAWITALIFGIAPGAIAISQFTRFYALQGLAFALGTIATYVLTTRRLRPAATIATAAGAVLAYACAVYLQLTTAIGLAGVAAWIAVEIGLRLGQGRIGRPGQLVLLALLGLGVVAAAVLLQTGMLARLFEMYRSTPLWGAEDKDNIQFYFRLFLNDYPTFWTLLPVAALIALARRPELARLCIVAFVTAFVLHSFAGMKHERYIYYAMPFFFVIWGIALAELLPHLRRLVVWSIDQILHLSRPSLARTWLNRVAFAMILILVLGSNIGFPRGLRMVISDTPLLYGDGSDWPAAAKRLQAAAGDAGVLLTTDDLRAIYYIGGYDVLINKSRLGETGSRKQFATDSRTGRPVISEPEALRRVMECYPSGLIIAPAVHWRKWDVLDDSMANLIVERATPISLPAPWKMKAYRWEHPGRAAADCSPLRQRVSAGR